MTRGSLAPAMLALATVLLIGSAEARPRVVEVKPKATLWGIAKRHGVSVSTLRAFNDLDKSDVLKAGQKLRIPPRGAKAKAKSRAAQSKKRTARASQDDSWVWAKPPRWTQTQKTKAQRGGINPCNTPNPGWRGFSKWNRAPSMGQMVMPNNLKPLANGNFNVMFHFHGHEPIRKEWVQVMDHTVLVAVTLGVSSGPYVQAFSNSKRFEQLVASVEKEVARKLGRKTAHARRIGLSAWSAGYGALLRILDQPFGKKRVDTAVVLDGMHSSYIRGRASTTQLGPFIDFARRASKGERHMFISHSSIIPPGYASSTETANLLVHTLGGRPRKARPRAGDPMGLELLSRYGKGNLQVRGFAGNDKMDHCAHIGLFRDILRVHVKPRWEGAPKKRRRSKKKR